MSDAATTKTSAGGVRRRDVVILCIVAALVVGAIATLAIVRSRQRVWFVSGLDVPVEIDVDGTQFEVGPKQRVDRSIATGIRVVQVRVGGEVVDETALDVPPMHDVVAYNILGAAPVYAQTIVYSSYTNSNRDNQVTFLGGTTAIVRDKVDYAFTEPPRSISVKGGDRHTREHVDVAPEGWPQTVGYLATQGDMTKASRVLRAVARLEPDHPAVVAYQHLVVMGEGPTVAAQLKRRARDAKPDELDSHYVYQRAMRRLGRSAELVAEYAERHQRAPDSPLAGALYAAVLGADEGRALADQLVARFPQSAEVREVAARIAYVTGDHARVVEVLGMPGEGPRTLDEHAGSLVALGRAGEAFELLSKAPAAREGEASIALTHGELAALTGSTAARRPDDEHGRAWVQSLLGEAVQLQKKGEEPDAFITTVDIQRLALKNPAEALAIAASAPTLALRLVHPAITMLLVGELVRVGNLAEAMRLLTITEASTIADQAVIDYAATGAEHPDLWRLDPEQRAAIDLGRARAAAQSGAPTAELLESIKRRDPLHGPVTTALRQWPPAAPPAGVVVALRRAAK